MDPQTQPAPPRSRRRRYDPQRRDRIVDVTLDVIAEHGVAGTTHRRVAAAADVPLGSMSYHFAGMDDLLREAFTRFATSVSDQFETRLSAATDTATAREAIVALVSEDVLGTRRDLLLTHELYTLAARDPAYRELTNAWMHRSRAALERHFDPATARMVDAVIEGLTIHRALDTEPQDPEIVRAAVDRITQVRPSR